MPYIYLVAQIGKDIDIAKKFLENNELVGIPTETVYGLAANALSEISIAKIFEVKNRPAFDPLIVHTHSLDSVYDFVTDIHPKLLKVAKAFWPGPLTLLLPKKNIIPYLLTSNLNRVGVRIPNHSMTLNLLKSLSFPLAAPSANPFGYISPSNAEHVNKQLGDKIQYILDGGACEVGIESTIIGEENNEIIIYRLGGLSIHEIENIVGKVNIELNESSNPKAPGQLKSHYAPRVSLYIGNLKELEKNNSEKKIGALVFGDYDHSNKHIVVKNLSPKADLREAAVNLFNYLRAFDEMDIDIIIADYLPPINLGMAINDRLKRAAKK
ncbi:MAG: L-threonylcarbamoyladenylate synthase [Bacteroidota bacterium]